MNKGFEAYPSESISKPTPTTTPINVSQNNSKPINKPIVSQINFINWNAGEY